MLETERRVWYEEEGGSISEDGGRGSVWWNNITSVSHGVGVGVEKWLIIT